MDPPVVTLITNSTSKVRSHTVSTVKKSMARTPVPGAAGTVSSSGPNAEVPARGHGGAEAS
jgi:hypothetical protein